MITDKKNLPVMKRSVVSDISVFFCDFCERGEPRTKGDVDYFYSVFFSFSNFLLSNFIDLNYNEG